MGSVQDYIDCPRCGRDKCFRDFYYKTGEEYIQCPDCGYYMSVEIKEEARSKKFNELVDGDWNIDELKKPYGAYRLRSKESKIHQGGSISSKKHFDRIIDNLSNLNGMDEFTVSRFIRGKIVVIDVLRKIKLDKIKNKI